MPPYDISVAAVQGFPESLALVFLAYAVLGLRAVPSRILALGLLNICLIFMVRAMNFSFPIHTLFSLMVMPVILSMWERVPLKAAALGWAFALGLLLVVESLVYGCILWAGIPWPAVLADKVWLALSGWPQILVITVLAFWIYRRGGVKLFRRYGVYDPE